MILEGNEKQNNDRLASSLTSLIKIFLHNEQARLNGGMRQKYKTYFSVEVLSTSVNFVNVFQIQRPEM